VRLPNGDKTRIGQRDFGHLVSGLTISTVVRHRTGHKPSPWGGSRLWSNRRKTGVCVPYQHFNLCSCWEGPRKKGQAFKPDLGNPAVRDGAAGKRKPWWESEPVLQSKEQERKPPPKAGAALVSFSFRA